ncbi:MAG TPA: alpha/beta fold hydrolase [Caulobacteraceae bacterium]|nr:alpha/beta fold hydrolase [Caulobacteraceae bacterium]
MDDDITRTAVTIWSEGSRLAGEVIRPAASAGPRPAILLCHGWAGLKEHLAERYAVPFARAGYVCLVFDYRGWGGSDGRLISVAGAPMLTEAGERSVQARVIRELVDPIDQVADVRACLAWLTSEAGVDPDRVGLWGSSYGGGHVVVVAATDERPRAVVAQIGGFGSPTPDPDWVAFQRRRAADKARAAIDPPVPQAIDAAPSLRGAPDVARQLFHEPIRAAERIRAPTLFIDAELEEYADPATHGYIAEVVKRHAPCERVTFPCTHYAVYDEYYQRALQLALDWFDRRLAGAER